MLKTEKTNSNIFTINLIIILSLIAIFDGGFDHNIVYYNLILASMSLIGYTIHNKEDIHISKSNPIIYLGLFLVWSGLSFIWSIHYTRTLIEFLQMSLFFLVFSMTMKLDYKNREKVKSIVILMGTLLGFLGILEYTIIKTGRIVATFTNPNPFATYLIMIFLYTWGSALRERRKPLYFSSVILLISIFLTGSRAGFIALILSFGFLFLGLKKKDIYRAVFGSMALIIFSLLMTKGIMLLAPIMQENISINRNLMESLIRKNSLLSSSLFGRLEYWKVAIKVFLTRPLLGYGMGTFFASYYIGYPGNRWFSRFVHNHYLQISAELGIIGIALFLLFIAVSFYHIYKRFKREDYPPYLPAAMAASIAFLIHIGMEFSYNFSGATVIFFYLLAMSIGDIEAEDMTNNGDNETKGFSLNYRFKYLLFIPMFALSIWYLSSVYLYEYSVKLVREGNVVKSNQVLTFTNAYHPINSFGYKLKSENYKSLYEESNDIEDLNMSIESMEDAIKRAPRDGDLYNKLGKLYLKKDDLIKVEENFIQAIEYGIYPINRYVDLADLYINRDNYIEAVKVLEEGSKLVPYAINAVGGQAREFVVFDSAIIYNRLYYIYGKENKLDLMEEQKEKLIEATQGYETMREDFLRIMESE